MTVNGTPRVSEGWGAGRPAVSFALLAGVLAVALIAGTITLFGSATVPVLFFAVIVAVALRGLTASYPHALLGACNGITLIRAALVATLAGAIFAPVAQSWAVFVIAGIALSMDGLDGWLARRTGLASDFGARFDMEVDAALGAVLAMILLASGDAGPEILILGFLRYAFVAVSLIMPALRGKLEESLRRKTICVVQIAVLTLLLCPILPAALFAPIAWIAAGLLVWSFAVDTLWLIRNAA
jgi:phosphatidylglycerophosphate synthase